MWRWAIGSIRQLKAWLGLTMQVDQVTLMDPVDVSPKTI